MALRWDEETRMNRGSVEQAMPQYPELFQPIRIGGCESMAAEDVVEEANNV